MKKRQLFFALSILFLIEQAGAAGPVGGSVVYDPAAEGKLAAMLQQAKEMYKTAKENLDKMVSMEKTIREAQEAYDTLSKYDLNEVAKSLQPGKDSFKSFAALRAQISNTEGKVSMNVGFVEGNLYRIQQLENLEILKRASATNLGEVNGKPNAATSAKVTAQSTAALAALAASEEQRRMKEDLGRSQAAELELQNLKSSKSVYQAMGK